MGQGWGREKRRVYLGKEFTLLGQTTGDNNNNNNNNVFHNYYMPDAMVDDL